MQDSGEKLLKEIVSSLVETPDAININKSIDEKGVLFTLTVDKGDIGRIIGKKGSTVEAIRTILRALGPRHNAIYKLKVNDAYQSQ